MNEYQKEQAIFEAANHGRFEKIFPLPLREAADANGQTQLDGSLTAQQKQLSQQQYQAL